MASRSQRGGAKRKAVIESDAEDGVEDEEYQQSANDDEDAADDDGSDDDALEADDDDDDDFATKPTAKKAASVKNKPAPSKPDAPPAKKPKTGKSKEPAAHVRTVKPDDPACAPRESKGVASTMATTSTVSAAEKAPKATTKEAASEPPSKAPKEVAAPASVSGPLLPKAAAPKAAAAAPKASKAASKAAASSSSAPPSADGVLNHLIALAGPSNAQMVAERFPGELTKGEAERRLTDLVAAGSAVSRESGKIKLFWANQAGVVAMSRDEDAAISRDLAAAQSTRAAQAAEINRLQQDIKALKNRRSLDEVRAEVASARIAADVANDEVEAMRKEQGGGMAMPPAEECAPAPLAPPSVPTLAARVAMALAWRPL